MADKMMSAMQSSAKFASASCTCGVAALHFSTPRPRLHLQCACRDCRQANEWVALRGGRARPDPLSLLYYFENDLVQVQGKERLELQQLREGARSTRCVATCCHSILAVDHPAYSGNVVMVPANSCKLAVTSLPPALAQVYVSDWTADIDGPLPPLPPPVVTELEDDVGDLALPPGVDPSKPWRAHFAQPPREPRLGVSLQDLFVQLGLPKIIGLEEGQRFGEALQGTESQ